MANAWRTERREHRCEQVEMLKLVDSTLFVHLDSCLSGTDCNSQATQLSSHPEKLSATACPPTSLINRILVSEGFPVGLS